MMSRQRRVVDVGGRGGSEDPSWKNQTHRDVISVEFMRDTQDASIVFFQVAEGFEGYEAALALFRNDIKGAGRTWAGDRSPATGPVSSLHYVTLILPWNEQDEVIA